MITLIVILTLITLTVVVTLTSYSKRCKKEAAAHKVYMVEARAEKAARKASYPKAMIIASSAYKA